MLVPILAETVAMQPIAEKHFVQYEKERTRNNGEQYA